MSRWRWNKLRHLVSSSETIVLEIHLSAEIDLQQLLRFQPRHSSCALSCFPCQQPRWLVVKAAYEGDRYPYSTTAAVAYITSFAEPASHVAQASTRLRRWKANITAPSGRAGVIVVYVVCLYGFQGNRCSWKLGQNIQVVPITIATERFS